MEILKFSVQDRNSARFTHRLLTEYSPSTGFRRLAIQKKAILRVCICKATPD